MSLLLYVVPTRDITVGDIIALAGALGKPLVDCTEGGIDLAVSSTDCRDLRISHPEYCHDFDYDAPDKVVVRAQPGVTQWHPTCLDFRVRSANATPFTLDEAYPIMAAACVHFDARPALVRNRRELKIGSPLPTKADTVETTNDFYGYNVAQAIATFTLNNDAYPGIAEERAFQCWHCGKMSPAHTFDPLGSDDSISHFYRLLGNCVANKRPACTACCTTLTVRPARPLARHITNLKTRYLTVAKHGVHTDGWYSFP